MVSQRLAGSDDHLSHGSARDPGQRRPVSSAWLLPAGSGSFDFADASATSRSPGPSGASVRRRLRNRPIPAPPPSTRCHNRVRSGGDCLRICLIPHTNGRGLVSATFEAGPFLRLKAARLGGALSAHTEGEKR